MFQVVVTDFLSDELAPERKVLAGVADVSALQAHNEEQLLGRVESADAIVLYHEIAMTRLSIDRLEKCRLIVRAGVGLDNVDLQFARQCGIPVANVPDYGSEEVADSAIALALSLARGVHLLNSRLRTGQGKWIPQEAAPLHRLRSNVFGIIGLGRIGSAVALRAKAIGMDVCYYDPYKPDGYDKALGIRRCEQLDELLASSYIVSMHCPLTDETQNMINAASLAKMRRGAFLVNTARGGVVDTSAIPPAIESGQLSGAGIDVLREEPPLEDDPLIKAWRDPRHPVHDRVIINPHAAFYSEEGLLDIRQKSAEACRRVLAGLPLRNVEN